MVGLMKASPREKIATLIKSAKSGTEVRTKLEPLRKLKGDWFQNDPVLVSEFLPCLFELQPDRFSAVRQLVTLLIGDIGLKHLDVLPEVVPVLTTALEDSTPAVARQALKCGIGLFRCILEKVAIQGLMSSELDDSLESAWTWMLKLKENICSMAFQPGSDSTRLLALKFVEVIILLYTPDPNGSSEPPPDQVFEVDFNISWLRGGHPLLNAGDLSIDASRNLGLLLDQLRLPAVKSLTHSMIIVLIKSLASIAVKRPAFYGRILPVLLGLDPSSAMIKGFQVTAAQYALKNAYMSCLDCTHPGAAPWRERLHGVLREIKSGKVAEQQFLQVSKVKDSLEDKQTDLFGMEEKPLIKASDTVQSSSGKKRLGLEDNNSSEKDDVSGKRVKSTPSGSGDFGKERKMELTSPLVESTSSKGDADNGPVHQLIAMFGALVAQGEKAVGSLDILISSISADLMAEVVMVNMRNLPHISPKPEGDEELHDLTGTNYRRKHPSSLAAEISELANGIPLIASLLDVKQQVHIKSDPQNEEQDAQFLDNSCVPLAESGRANGVASPVGSPSSIRVEKMEGIESAIEPERSHLANLENEIPGLEFEGLARGIPQTVVTPSSVALSYPDDACPELATSFDGKSTSNLVQSISSDGSEELSPQSAATDANSLMASTETSVRFSNQVTLPKLSAPVVVLTDEQKDGLQQCAFTRIIEVYKEMVMAGGIDMRFTLLAYLGVEFPLELDPWKALREHILSDYSNHWGHELTLRVLYRLFGEAEADHDFFSSKTATSDFEMFLQTVVETLKNDFPATDKSLNRLLSEVPYIPKSVFNSLECLCCPVKDEKESLSGDRVTQGLSIVWSLILLRPPIRDVCLKIALQSAVHHSDDVRMKAIRLVANKLYPLSYISQQIEDFAKKSLLSVVSGAEIAETAMDIRKDSDTEKMLDVNPSMSHTAKNISVIQQPNASESTSSSSISEANQSMALYFALCTKEVHGHIPLLVRTMGASFELLEIVSDPPTGSEDLLLQVLHTLTDSVPPSPELISAVKKVYDAKLKNVEILIPFLPYLTKEEVLRIFPRIVDLPIDKFRATLSHLIQGSSPTDPLMEPSEVLIAIHGIDPEREGIPLKRVTDACNVCFQQQLIFTQQVLAKALNQLVEQIPLPLLFMRTVLQAIGAFPDLVEFVMEILSRLVSKQIWKHPKLWVGFLKCASLTKPQSFSVLLQLPPAQLEIALNKTPAIREPLVGFASQPNIKSTLPRSVLVVLGLASPLESQNSSQVQTPQPQPQPRADPEIQVQYQTEAKSQPQVQSPIQFDSQSQPQPESPVHIPTEIQTQSPVQTKTETQALSQSPSGSHSQADTQPETQTQSQSHSGSQAQTQTEPLAETTDTSNTEQEEEVVSKDTSIVTETTD
uniref:Symplekin n=1 Tax=Kalanchoe fedtschenkoi TaxID=63787 RepID=A0A7N0VDI7_KALFE